jgi:predicted CopG family antitoxin
MTTTIQISNDVKSLLDRMKIFERETYNEVILNMIEDNMRVNQQTAKDLDLARKEKGIPHEKVKQMLGL